MKNLARQLQDRREHNLYRTRLIVDTPQGVTVRIDGRDYLSFCSNDYLGLANHPDVVAAFHQGLDEFGSGSGAAHLITGHSRAHHALNHASLLDGARLSGARLLRYHHGDAADLDARLANAPAGELLVATDGVFSMDGDVAPLAPLAEVAARHGAWFMVDDAHGLGVTGPGGRGSVAQAGLGMAQVPILVGTLGKAFGTFGAFVAGSDDLIETLIQEARTYIYTTAPPSALASATRTALRLVREEDWRREHLQRLINRFRNGARQLGLALCDSETPIQPLLAGAADAALRLSQALREQGILITAIRPPTVAEGASRLRITFSAAHSEQQVDRLLEVLEQIITT
jgi:8-amino-7-oxononanoate synthase